MACKLLSGVSFQPPGAFVETLIPSLAYVHGKGK